VIRRVASVILFAFGGWILAGQLMVAFIDFEPGAWDNAGMIGIFLVIALPFLLLAAWISPGERWHEIGLTILIAVGVTVMSVATAAAIFVDPGMQKFLPPMPEMHFAPLWGAVDLFVLAAAGWWLYRRSA